MSFDRLIDTAPLKHDSNERHARSLRFSVKGFPRSPDVRRCRKLQALIGMMRAMGQADPFQRYRSQTLEERMVANDEHGIGPQA